MEGSNNKSAQLGSHQLAAIMFTDIEGYTALMQHDEARAIEIRDHHRKIFDSITLKFGGKILQYYGDGTLSIFSSAIDAVRCGIELQLAFSTEPRIPVRIGIHSGDIIVSDDDVVGDGVNVASRIESLSTVGGVFISEKVYDEIKNQKDIETQSMGTFELKNVDKPLEVFAICNEGLLVPEKSEIEGKTKADSSPISQVSDKSKKRQLTRWSIYLLNAILIGYLMYAFGLFERSPTLQDDAVPSIAVLPFKIIGEDQEGAYFAEGVREEILNHLTRIEGLNVKSRTVVDRFEEESTSTAKLVSELNLSHYLEGSARKEGDRIRITVQFIDAKNNEHLWAENYERSYANIWDTQSEIARKVAETTEVEISQEAAAWIDKIPTDNPEAWDDFLKALFYLKQIQQLQDTRGSEEEIRRAGVNLVRYLTSSIENDPEFALGYSVLGGVYRQIDPDSALVLVNRAIDLDPDLAEPYWVRGEYYAYTLKDSVAAMKDFLQAINNDPSNPYAYWYLAGFYNYYQQSAFALKYIFKAMEQGPESWDLGRMLRDISTHYVHVGDYNKAIYYIDRALVFDPDNIAYLAHKSHIYRVSQQYDRLYSNNLRIMELSPFNQGPFEMGMYYLLTGDYTQSLKNFDQYFSPGSAGTITPEVYTNSHMYAFVLQKNGRKDEAKEKYEWMKAALETGFSATSDYEYAKIYAAQGMTDSAYYHLQMAVEGTLLWGLADFMERDPLFEDIVDEEEFQRLVKLAKENVKVQQDKVRMMEASGEIPESLDRIELF